MFNIPSPDNKEVKKEVEKEHKNMLNRFPSVPNLEKRSSNAFKPKDFDSIANEQKRMKQLMTGLRKRPKQNNYSYVKEEIPTQLERLRLKNNKRLYSKYNIEAP